MDPRHTSTSLENPIEYSVHELGSPSGSNVTCQCPEPLFAEFRHPSVTPLATQPDLPGLNRISTRSKSRFTQDTMEGSSRFNISSLPIKFLPPELYRSPSDRQIDENERCCRRDDERNARATRQGRHGRRRGRAS
eukprot:scaffold453_cov315-Pavlova_lutheri.AAC.4